MKTVLTIATVLLLLGSSKAELPPVSETIYEDEFLTKSLEKTFEYPSEVQTELSGTVIAKFKLDTNGNVIIDEILATHPVFSNYVRAQLESFRPDMVKEQTLGKDLVYKISFNTDK